MIDLTISLRNEIGDVFTDSDYNKFRNICKKHRIDINHFLMAIMTKNITNKKSTLGFIKQYLQNNRRFCNYITQIFAWLITGNILDGINFQFKNLM